MCVGCLMQFVTVLEVQCWLGYLFLVYVSFSHPNEVKKGHCIHFRVCPLLLSTHTPPSECVLGEGMLELSCFRWLLTVALTLWLCLQCHLIAKASWTIADEKPNKTKMNYQICMEKKRHSHKVVWWELESDEMSVVWGGFCDLAGEYLYLDHLVGIIKGGLKGPSDGHT